MDNNSEESKSSVGYFITGAVIGSVLAVLFAPKAGRETREQMGSWIQDKRDKGRVAVREALETGRRTLRRGQRSMSGV